MRILKIEVGKGFMLIVVGCGLVDFKRWGSFVLKVWFYVGYYWKGIWLRFWNLDMDFLW